jgi:hypothetical protein
VIDLNPRFTLDYLTIAILGVLWLLLALSLRLGRKPLGTVEAALIIIALAQLDLVVGFSFHGPKHVFVSEGLASWVISIVAAGPLLWTKPARVAASWQERFLLSALRLGALSTALAVACAVGASLTLFLAIAKGEVDSTLIATCADGVQRRGTVAWYIGMGSCAAALGVVLLDYWWWSRKVESLNPSR